MEKVLLIINPIAGTMKIRQQMMEVLQIISSADLLPTIYITKCKGDAERYAKENAAGYDRVICSGGDGTFSETVSGVMQCGKKVPIGYIPAGTTNDLARTLGLSFNIKKATTDAAGNNKFGFDVGKVDGGAFFSYVASFGIFTKTSYSTPQEMKNILGQLAYLLEGVKELSNIKSYDMVITADGVEHAGEYIFGAITNTLSIAGLVKYPKSKVSLNDGNFEIMMIKKPEDIIELGNILVAMTDGSYNDPHIFFCHAKEVTVECDEEVSWTLDGEFGGDFKTLKVKNENACVEVFVPKNKK